MAEANETTPSTGQEPANLNEPTAEDLAREDEELARRIAEEQAAEAVGEGEEDEGPRDWQRFYMGYHEVRGRPAAGDRWGCNGSTIISTPEALLNVSICLCFSQLVRACNPWAVALLLPAHVNDGPASAGRLRNALKECTCVDSPSELHLDC